MGYFNINQYYILKEETHRSEEWSPLDILVMKVDRSYNQISITLQLY